MLGSVRDLASVGRGFLGGVFRGAERQRGIRVFRYHGVVDQQKDRLLERNQHLLRDFRGQMAYLRKFRLLGLNELLAELERPSRSSVPAAVVTFDDGFANNLRVADVMSRFRLPWCLFVPVGEIGEKRAMWLDELSLLLLAGRATEIGAFGGRWSLTSREARERAFYQLRPLFKSLAGPETRRAMAEIRAQYPGGESQRLIEEFPGLRMLSWNELGELAQAGVEIGSHGVYHDLHHSWQPRDERMRELSESRRTLESRLGRPCRSFAFPNGDYLAESEVETASAGYTAAFTTSGRTVAPNDSRHLLPRLAAPRSLQRFVRVHWFKDTPRPAPPVVAPAGSRS